MSTRWLALLGYGAAVGLVVLGAFIEDRPFERTGGWIAAGGFGLALLTTFAISLFRGSAQARQILMMVVLVLAVVGLLLLIAVGVAGLMFCSGGAC